MNTPTTLQMCAWRTFFSRATTLASEAMSSWTHGRVDMSLDDVWETSLCEVGQALNLGCEASTLVRIGVDGNVGGQLILTFDDRNAHLLIESLLGPRATDTYEWSPLELSAFCETGNIIGSVYLNQLTELTGTRLWPLPPEVVRDYAMSVVEQAVMYQAQNDDRVLVCQISFRCGGQTVMWNLVVVPSPELLELIATSLM
jgi:chemotaxis protein CheC